LIQSKSRARDRRDPGLPQRPGDRRAPDRPRGAGGGGTGQRHVV